MKLTATQAKALKLVQARETVFAYNGISVATARVLARLGLVTFTSHGVSETYSFRTHRTRYAADWSITIVAA